MQSLCCGSHHNGEVTKLSLHHKERIFPAVLVLSFCFPLCKRCYQITFGKLWWFTLIFLYRVNSWAFKMSYNVLPDIFLRYKVVQRDKNYFKLPSLFFFSFVSLIMSLLITGGGWECGVLRQTLPLFCLFVDKDVNFHANGFFFFWGLWELNRIVYVVEKKSKLFWTFFYQFRQFWKIWMKNPSKKMYPEVG